MVDEFGVEPPIVAYVTRAERRRLIAALDFMNRYITQDGDIIDGERPWIHFRLLEDLGEKG